MHGDIMFDSCNTHLTQNYSFDEESQEKILYCSVDNILCQLDIE